MDQYLLLLWGRIRSASCATVLQIIFRSGRQYTQPVSHVLTCLNRVFILLCRQEKQSIEWVTGLLIQAACASVMFYISKYLVMSMKIFILVIFNGDRYLNFFFFFSSLWGNEILFFLFWFFILTLIAVSLNPLKDLCFAEYTDYNQLLYLGCLLKDSSGCIL